jgi:hypothetical protein
MAKQQLSASQEDSRNFACSLLLSVGNVSAARRVDLHMFLLNL